MTTRKRTKIVHEGKYIAEVDVEILEDETGWSPYLSLDDAYKLDDVREALRRGDIAAASRSSRVYCPRLSPRPPVSVVPLRRMSHAREVLLV
jgi:hypothetical protein